MFGMYFPFQILFTVGCSKVPKIQLKQFIYAVVLGYFTAISPNCVQYIRLIKNSGALRLFPNKRKNTGYRIKGKGKCEG